MPLLFLTLYQPSGKSTKIKALCDYGSGGSLVAKKHAPGLKVTQKDHMSWCTVVGRFSTNGSTNAKFTLTELNPTATITHKLHVAPKLGAYNMILGRDLVTKLGIIINFKEQLV